MVEVVKKNKGGRPSKYDPKYCQEIIDFFDIKPYREVVEKKVTERNGTVTQFMEMRANDMKFIAQFARHIGVNVDTLHEWKKKYPEFSDAFNSAKELQKEHLIINGLFSNFNPFFAFQTAKNIMGWKDRTEVDHKGASQIINIITPNGNSTHKSRNNGSRKHVQRSAETVSV